MQKDKVRQAKHSGAHGQPSVDYLKYSDAFKLSQKTNCYNNWEEFLADPSTVLVGNALKLKGRPGKKDRLLIA